MSSQSLPPDTTPVVQSIRSLVNCQNQQKHAPSRNSQLLPAKRRISVAAGERDSSQGGSSVPSTIQGQNSTPSSSLNNSRVPDITQSVASTPSATQRRSIITSPPRRVHTVVTHQLPVDRYRQSHRVALFPAPHPSLQSLPLLSVVWETCLPASRIQQPVRSLQIHCEHERPKRIRDRSSGNCNHRRCLHLNQWSPVVAASIDLVTQA